MIGPRDAAPAVRLEGVSRFFAARGPGGGRRGVLALDDVSLTIGSGSRFGVVGESGAGKTALMRLIAGLDRPTGGRVVVDGTDITGLPERRLGALRSALQMVFQDPAGSLDPRMRVGAIVAEPLHRLARADARDRVREALRDVGLEDDAAGRYPHQFSGGQRQRISIARAIVARPRILIADEAVSALDVTIQSHILELLSSVVAAHGITLIFVSHDLSVVRALCDEVAVLRRGHVVEWGPTDRVYRRPEHPYTRELLDVAPSLAKSLTAARARAGGRARGSGAGQEGPS